MRQWKLQKGLNLRVYGWQYVVSLVTHPCNVSKLRSLAKIQRKGLQNQKDIERCVIFCLEVCFYAVIPPDSLVV